MDNVIQAICIFNSKHRKYKISYDTLDNNVILLKIKANKYDYTEIKVHLNINELTKLDELIEVLEDLIIDLK